MLDFANITQDTSNNLAKFYCPSVRHLLACQKFQCICLRNLCPFEDDDERNDKVQV